MSWKHEQGRAAYRRGNYAASERLVRKAYGETGNPHSALNVKVAQYAQGKITRSELDRTVYALGLEKGGHGKSVLEKGY